MACFLVPAAEAVVVTVITQAMKKKQEKIGAAGEADGKRRTAEEGKIPFTRKLQWLSNLLWGGAGLLAFEHVWHGEVVPWFPFLTAAANPADTAAMLHEMSTVGVSMAALVTLVWVGMLLVTARMVRRVPEARTAEK